MAKAVAALVADPTAKQRFLDNARTGGAALWLVARTSHRADHLVQLLADDAYSSLRYYGDHGVTDVERMPTNSRHHRQCRRRGRRPGADAGRGRHAGQSDGLARTNGASSAR
jgi:hypothetical protein